MGNSNFAVTVMGEALSRMVDTSLNLESEVNTTMDTTANTKIRVARNSAATAWGREFKRVGREVVHM
jgi:hypothetical protein